MNAVLKRAFDLMTEGGYYPPSQWIEWHIENGYYYVDPECVILAHWIKDEQGPILYIWLAVGERSLQRFCEIAPRGVERIAFARGIRKPALAQKIYQFDRFRRLCSLLTESLSPS